jgi:hypothetical protein
MEDKRLEAAPVDVQAESEATYAVISYQGGFLPDNYVNLIRSSWLRSYKYGNEYFKLIDNDAYFTKYHNFVSQMLTRPNVKIRLAVLSDDVDVCLGWSVVQDDSILQYVYVQKDYRKIGIGKSLVPPTIDTITHLTTAGMSIWANKCKSKPDDNSHKPLVVFDPFI